MFFVINLIDYFELFCVIKSKRIILNVNLLSVVIFSDYVKYFFLCVCFFFLFRRKDHVEVLVV